MKGKTRSTHPEGFTLVELAIVLVVIGIVISLGISLMGPLTKRVKYGESREIVNGAVESVNSWASTNRRLPNAATEFAGAVRSSQDSFGRALHYIVDSNLVTIPSGSTDALCGRKTTSLSVSDCSSGACTTITNVAFVVISGSENFNIQTHSIGGVVTVYDIDATDRDDCTDANTCPSAAAMSQDPDRPEQYDDIVKWVSLDELRTKVGCQGAQLRIVNNELPFGAVNSAYVAGVYADGGVPFGGGNFRWCVQNSAANAPANLAFTGPGATNVPFSSNCAALAESSWVLSAGVNVSGSPNASGSYSLSFYARDNNDPVAAANDNIAGKAFVITVNP
ncbi:MAG: prepilin-type N-terminal cleavage/methylation domain-containing protein [Alphaproteobacteria bacterium]|uniref:Prepilin-type N-terminal cleavage/methylation domain-containing protein n=1 Tax=Candidatus Nitrobium versatile TaxID=2884831 RepID=A0A953J7A8_9BACT|nr:prepilin-type N-terminal cleavage/methylation domain-containing protein [Candidatus Nitrobium versatile]